MNILLVNVPYTFELYRETTIPLGIAYIASSLRQKHTVKIVDLNVENISQQEFINLIQDFQPKVVGFSVKTPTFPICRDLARLIKKTDKNIRIVFGGPHPTACPEDVLKENCIDYVVIGEGEITADELMSAIENNTDLMRVKGIGFKENNKVIITKGRGHIKDLDQIDFPSFDLFPIHKYNGYGFRNGFYMITSRGCPYSCIYCAAHLISGKKIRRRSIRNVIKELKILINKYQANWIVFDDDVFTIDKEYTVQLCNEIIRQNLQLSWWCNTRVDNVDKYLLSVMRKAGCQQIAYGIESGTQRVLNYIKKGTTLKQAEIAIRLTRQAGIIPCGNFIVNFPFERMHEIRATLDLSKKLRVTYFRISMAVPYPKTELWERCLEGNLLSGFDDYLKYGYLNNIIISNKYANQDEVRKIVRETNIKMLFRLIWFWDSFKMWLNALQKSKRPSFPVARFFKYYKNLCNFSSDNHQILR